MTALREGAAPGRVPRAATWFGEALISHVSAAGRGGSKPCQYLRNVIEWLSSLQRRERCSLPPRHPRRESPRSRLAIRRHLYSTGRRSATSGLMRRLGAAASASRGRGAPRARRTSPCLETSTATTTRARRTAAAAAASRSSSPRSRTWYWPGTRTRRWRRAVRCSSRSPTG
jgi:hypothetical protein